MVTTDYFRYDKYKYVIDFKSHLKGIIGSIFTLSVSHSIIKKNTLAAFCFQGTTNN